MGLGSQGLIIPPPNHTREASPTARQREQQRTPPPIHWPASGPGALARPEAECTMLRRSGKSQTPPIRPIWGSNRWIRFEGVGRRAFALRGAASRRLWPPVVALASIDRGTEGLVCLLFPCRCIDSPQTPIHRHTAHPHYNRNLPSVALVVGKGVSSSISKVRVDSSRRLRVVVAVIDDRDDRR